MGDLKASTPFIDSLISLDDFQRAARDRLPKALYEYVASGSDDEQTLWENRQGFHRVLLCPRVLVDVSRLDTTVTFFGDSSHRSSMPVLIAPAGVHCLMHPEGEKATARAAARAGVVMGVSQHATTAMEDVARAAREQQQHHHHPHAPPLWYQLYILKDRPLTASLLRRALSAGYRAVALTVDSCRFGSREADWRNGFDGLPEGLSLANYPTRQAYDDRQHAAWDQNSEALLDDSVTWEEAVALVRSVCGPGVPLLLKGVLSPHDAVRAAQLGCEGIIVSNHGGRQLDSCVSSIEALPRIASALRQAGFTIDADLRASKTTPGGSAGGGGRQQRVVTLVLDSGVRRGTDVVKALALGATAVMIGKPVFFALALQGETGVSRVLALLRAELEAAMALCGCPSLHHITSDLVVTKEGGHSYIRPSRL